MFNRLGLTTQISKSITIYSCRIQQQSKKIGNMTIKKIEIKLTKETDKFYLVKRNISDEYSPDEAYEFEKWKGYFDKDVRRAYESLHEHLLFTDKKQEFERAVNVFKAIDEFLKEIRE